MKAGVELMMSRGLSNYIWVEESGCTLINVVW